MQLIIPHVDTFPLFCDVPYTIVFTTLSAPFKRKVGAPPEEALFPCAPRDPSEIDFELRRFVDMKTLLEPSNPEEHVADIIPKAHPPVHPVTVDVGEYVWLPEVEGRTSTGRGRWKQVVTFRSVMHLRYTPTFASDVVTIKVRTVLVGVGVESRVVVLHR